MLPGLDIWGSSNPAKHVGGDFFDIQELRDGTVYFCVGDVSGKGIPAALFMATSRTLIRSLAFQGYSPDLYPHV